MRQLWNMPGRSLRHIVSLSCYKTPLSPTNVCPGSHFCYTGTEYCEETAFPAVDDNGVWRQGTGILMNQNAAHRGPAHEDPESGDRSMLVLTFAPKPLARSETRQMPIGLSYSLRWEMWGHTLRDLAKASTAMLQPWAKLRAFGVYKSADARWGTDYVTSASMRIPNGDFLDYSRDSLDEFVDSGGIKWMPRFLHGEVDDEGTWNDFYFDTIVRCENFVKRVLVWALLIYFSLCGVRKLVTSRARSSAAKGGSFIGIVFLRLLLCFGAVASLAIMINRRVDRTNWAVELRAGRLYVTPFEDNEEPEFSGPTVFPARWDVLFETRYGSDHLAMYNHFIEYHPGNREWRHMLSELGNYASYKDLNRGLQDAVAEYVVMSTVEKMGSRFLYQDFVGGVEANVNGGRHQESRIELLVGSNMMLHKLNKQIRSLLSDCKFGHLRGTAMCKHWTPATLKQLRRNLVGEEISSKGKSFIGGSRSKTEAADATAESALSGMFWQLLLPNTFVRDESIENVRRPRGQVKPVPKVEELAWPEDREWFAEGDHVQVLCDGLWWQANVKYITGSDTYRLGFANGDTDEVEREEVHWFVPFNVADDVECMDGGGFIPCTIDRENPDGTYNVYLEDDTLLEGVEGMSICRKKEEA